MQINDWVIVQRANKAHVGYVSNIEGERCRVAILDMRSLTLSEPTPKEIISIQCDQFTRLGEMHWHVKLDDASSPAA